MKEEIRNSSSSREGKIFPNTSICLYISKTESVAIIVQICTMLKVFSQCLLLVFPSSLEQEECLEKVTNSRPPASNLHNLFSTLFLLSRTGKTSKSLTLFEKLSPQQIQRIIATKYYLHQNSSWKKNIIVIFQIQKPKYRKYQKIIYFVFLKIFQHIM